MRLTATELTIAASLARGLDSIERSLASPDEDLAVPNAHRTGDVVVALSADQVRALLIERRAADTEKLAALGLRWEPSTDPAQSALGQTVVQATDWRP